MLLTYRADSSNHFAENTKKFPQVYFKRSDHSILLSHVVGFLESVSDNCYTTHTLSLTMYSPHLQRASFCHFLPEASLFIFSAHIFATLTLLFFSPLHLSLSSLTLSLHWVIDLSVSHLALCWALFSQTPPSLFFPLLDLSYLFFASASGSLKNIKKSSSLSFLFLSPSGLCVVPFLSVYVSLCPTDHPVGPSAKLY